MYLIIGKENCTNCEITKMKLKNKEIEFEYKLLEDLTTDEKKDYMKMAREKGILEMPLIIKDGIMCNSKEVV